MFSCYSVPDILSDWRTQFQEVPAEGDAKPECDSPKSEPKISPLLTNTALCWYHIYKTCLDRKCRFAHHDRDLNPVPVPRNYKSNSCKFDEKKGKCHYTSSAASRNQRFLFIRTSAESLSKAPSKRLS